MIDYAQALIDGRIVLEPALAPPLDGDDYTLVEVAKLPLLTSLNPNTAVVTGPDVTMHAVGDFPPDGVIYIDGDAQVTERSGEDLTTVVSPGSLAVAAHPVDVRSFNGTSAAVNFTVTAV